MNRITKFHRFELGNDIFLDCYDDGCTGILYGKTAEYIKMKPEQTHNLIQFVLETASSEGVKPVNPQKANAKARLN